MKTITQFAGQNWLITPAALAVGEPQPTSIKEQKWLLTLTGVAIVNITPNFNGNSIHETLQILPDMNGPLKFAINRFSVPVPANPRYTAKGLTKITPLFQLEEWSPFASLGSIFDQNQAVNAGFAVDTWKPSPFLTLSETGLPNIHQIFQGIRVDVAVQDKDAILHRVNYHISLLGKIVFAKPDPCETQVNALNEVQSDIDKHTATIESLEDELKTAPSGKEHARLSLLLTKEKELLLLAEQKLEPAKQALSVCRNRTQLGDFDNGGVLNQ